MERKLAIGMTVAFSALLNLLSCHQEAEKEIPDSTVMSRIEADLQDKPQATYSIELQHSDLPKTKYVADMDHSSVSFRTGHWEIVDLIGWVSDFEIVMFADKEDFTDAVISARVDPRSIVMPNKKMQGSVKKSPYLDTEAFPIMEFNSRGMRPIAPNLYKLTGTLTINGVGVEVSFNVQFNGFAYPGEQSICGFNVNGAFNRHDFNIAGEETLHSGNLIHSDSIYLNMSLRME